MMSLKPTLFFLGWGWRSLCEVCVFVCMGSFRVWKTPTASSSPQPVASHLAFSRFVFAWTHPTCALFQSRKQILSAFCFTFAAGYLFGPRLLLFLHVPDIIIAVRRMIICLLWKLADCLSLVPEELPLKGVPLKKHHESDFSRQSLAGAERATPDKEGATSNAAVFLGLNASHQLLCSFWLPATPK